MTCESLDTKSEIIIILWSFLRYEQVITEQPDRFKNLHNPIFKEYLWYSLLKLIYGGSCVKDSSIHLIIL